MNIKPKEKKIKDLLSKQGIDGAIVSSPENFFYVTGFAGHQHTVSRMAGFSLAVVSADDNTPTHITTMDFELPTFEKKNNSGFVIEKYDTWVGVKKWEEVCNELVISTPEKLTSSMDKLVDFIERMNLTDKIVGLELDYIPVNYYNTLIQKFPNAKFVNVSELFVFSRSVKEPDEIEAFKTLCAVADNAFYEVSKIAKIGVSEKELLECFKINALKSGVCIPSSWSMFSSGPNCSCLGLPTDRLAQDGDVIKFDAGVNAEFSFFTTDTSRAWILGNAKKEFFELKDRLYEAQRKMIAAAKPGLPICELFQIGYQYVKEKYPCYVRGHMGHSISLGPATAEAPYINSTTTRLLEPGMILAIEAPCYIDGDNGFNIEDMVLITETGCEVLTPKTPHYLP